MIQVYSLNRCGQELLGHSNTSPTGYQASLTQDCSSYMNKLSISVHEQVRGALDTDTLIGR